MMLSRDDEPTGQPHATSAVALHEQLRAINERLLLAVLREQEQADEARRLADALAHRALFHDRLAQILLTAHRDSTVFALLLIDLNGFKAVNDHLGHHAGDLLLQQVAGRLRDTLRASDTAARLGGDEFAVLLPDVTRTPDAILAGQRILDSMQRPFMIHGLPQRIGASIGVALYPEHGADTDTLLRQADVAMYIAKGTHGTIAVAGIVPSHGPPAPGDRAVQRHQRRGPTTASTDAAPPVQTSTLNTINATIVNAGELNEQLLLAGLREQALADQLRRQLAFTAAITGNLGEGVCAVDQAQRITFANPATERLLGWPVAELLGRGIHEILPGRHDALEEVLRVGTTHRDDNTVGMRRDRATIPVAYSAVPIVADGVIVGMVLTLRDIAAWKEIEAERARSNAELERRVTERTAELSVASTQLRLIFAQLPAIVWTTDTDLRFTFVAGAALAAVGVVPEQILGLRLHELLGEVNGEPPGHGVTLLLEHQRVLAGEPASCMFAVEGQNLQVYIEPLREANGRIVGVIGVAQDITELSMRRLHDDFIATVSHQLLTPLATARAGLGLLSGSVSDRLEPDDRHLLGNIERNIGRLGIQLNDLLTLNQLKARAGPLTPSNLDLRAVVDNALLVVQPLLLAKGQALTVVLPTTLPAVGDSDALTQAVINLVFNAHRHTPPGTHIAISGQSSKTESTLTIRDRGPGIPIAARERIFRRFQRLDSPDSVVSGSGLGLAIVREIAERHGGKVWVEGEPGDGAIFHLTLPHGDGESAHGEVTS